MKKLPQVEAAKTLMSEATKWSVMKWLREKKTVRRAADQANAALDQLSLELKQQWPKDLKAAYDALTKQSAAQAKQSNGQNNLMPRVNGYAIVVMKIKEADDAAYRARMIAEEAFEDAEKHLSTRLAREGCLKAIRAWELQEEAIEKSAQVRLTSNQFHYLHSGRKWVTSITTWGDNHHRH